MFLRVLVTVLVLAAGCSAFPSDRSPSGALRLFLEAMADTGDDPTARARAFGLLAPDSRRALEARAREASAVSGRALPAYTMLVEGRYRLRFRPRTLRGFEERVVGDRAIVVVHGASGRERAEVPMVREGDAWRVVLVLPEATPTATAGSAE